MSYDYQYDNYGIHGFMGDLVMEFELQDEGNKEVLILCHHFSDSFKGQLISKELFAGPENFLLSTF